VEKQSVMTENEWRINYRTGRGAIPHHQHLFSNDC